MRRFLWIFLALSFLASCKSTAPTTYVPQDGDLLFQDIDCGNFCIAIEKVTQSYGGKRFCHVGIVRVKPTGTVVVEANNGVQITPIDSFIHRSLDEKGHNKVTVGRLKPEYRHLIPAALDFAESLNGKPYDDVFDINNDRYYCSELVYLGFKHANHGQEVFPLEPMTFKDPDTGETFPIWTEYYAKLGVPIPEGQPGLNPGGLSRSDKVEIVYSFY